MKILQSIRPFMLLFVAMILPSVALAVSDTLVFSGSNGIEPDASFGTAKKEKYDVAMHICDAELVGQTIHFIRFNMGRVTNISDVKLWMSENLNTVKSGTKTENAPDIMSVDADCQPDGTVTVTLPTPYTIGIGGVYVGCSFAVSQLDDTNKYPIPYAKASGDNFFIHSSITYSKWNDLSVRGGLPIEVGLTGGIASAVSAAIVSPELFGQVSVGTPLVVTLKNHGSRGVRSIGYSYVQGDQVGMATINLETPLPPIFGFAQNVSVSLPPAVAKGNYPVTLSVTEVNGETNPLEQSMSASVTVYNRLPKHRAVMEEYTGTWCRNCPRGFVGLEIMNRLYPDDFIGISYHNKDAMEIMSREQFPNDVSGFPDGYLDRNCKTDAYWGFGTEHFGLDEAWLAVSSAQAEAGVQVEARLTPDGAHVDVAGSVYFPVDVSHDGYSVEVVLTADSLHGVGTGWNQSNVYNTDRKENYPEPEFEQFLYGESVVSGLYFNDVIVATSRLTGDDVVLPMTFAADEDSPFVYTFAMADVKNTSGEPLVQNLHNLNVAALLKDAEGRIVNAAKTKVDASALTGISTLTLDDFDRRPAAYYNLSGVKTAGLMKGINIVRTIGGKTVKIMR